MAEPCPHCHGRGFVFFSCGTCQSRPAVPRPMRFRPGYTQVDIRHVPTAAAVIAIARRMMKEPTHG